MAKTADEIDDLKRQWRADPCWDIESTEGFEEHVADLKAYSQHMQTKWKQKYQDRLREYAQHIGLDTNLRLAEYIRSLEKQIEQLQKAQA